MCAHAKIYRNSKRQAMFNRAHAEGPAALGTEEKLNLLDDALLLSRLRLDVWSSAETHPAWEIPGHEDKGAA